MGGKWSLNGGWAKYRLDVCPLRAPINSQKIAFAPFPAVFRRLRAQPDWVTVTLDAFSPPQPNTESIQFGVEIWFSLELHALPRVGYSHALDIIVCGTGLRIQLPRASPQIPKWKMLSLQETPHH